MSSRRQRVRSSVQSPPRLTTKSSPSDQLSYKPGCAPLLVSTLPHKFSLNRKSLQSIKKCEKGELLDIFESLYRINSNPSSVHFHKLEKHPALSSDYTEVPEGGKLISADISFKNANGHAANSRSAYRILGYSEGDTFVIVNLFSTAPHHG